MKKEYLIYKLSDEVKNSCKIPREAFGEYGVKRGLRNEDGSGVLVGLTNIGNVIGYERDDDGTLKPSAGKLPDTRIVSYSSISFMHILSPCVQSNLVYSYCTTADWVFLYTNWVTI